MIRRINLYGGPGTGKSTMAAGLYCEMKTLSNYNNHSKQFELVREYVKSWAWEGRSITGFDQFYIFAKQMRAEEICLKNGVDVVISDSPLPLSFMYTAAYNLEGRSEIRSMLTRFEHLYPAMHILLTRDDSKPYNGKGRYQTLEEAKKLDQLTKTTLQNLGFPYIEVKAFDTFSLNEIVQHNLKL